jgi:putative ABC transport system permease protein
MKDQDEVAKSLLAIQKGEKYTKSENTEYSYEDFLNLNFKLVLNTDYYTKENNIWINKQGDATYMKGVLDNAENIKVVGIIVPNEESKMSTSDWGLIGYTKSLEEHLINKINSSEIAKEQRANQDLNIFTGMPFSDTTSSTTNFDYSNLTDEQKAYMASLSSEEVADLMATYSQNMNNTYETNLKALGIVDLSKPSSINIYPKDFEGKENDVINYTDIVGLMMTSVTSIIDTVSYVLIAFVAISLVVSSIMIGIITYISVLERTKEIGILRSIGASKKDVSRVFNAETFIVGLTAGLIGIGITALLIIPANIIIKYKVGVSNLAKLPLFGAVLLVLISMILTVIAGLIPAKMASKKDPVIALRTE